MRVRVGIILGAILLFMCGLLTTSTCVSARDVSVLVSCGNLRISKLKTQVLAEPGPVSQASEVMIPTVETYTCLQRSL